MYYTCICKKIGWNLYTGHAFVLPQLQWHSYILCWYPIFININFLITACQISPALSSSHTHGLYHKHFRSSLKLESSLEMMSLVEIQGYVLMKRIYKKNLLPWMLKSYAAYCQGLMMIYNQIISHHFHPGVLLCFFCFYIVPDQG